MFRVIETFADLQDHEHIYHTGDAFPRVGFEASDERIRELSGSANRLGRPLIAFEEDPVESVEESNEPVEEPIEEVVEEPMVESVDRPAEEPIEEKPKQKKRK